MTTVAVAGVPATGVAVDVAGLAAAVGSAAAVGRFGKALATGFAAGGDAVGEPSARGTLTLVQQVPHFTDLPRSDSSATTLSLQPGHWSLIDMGSLGADGRGGGRSGIRVPRPAAIFNVRRLRKSASLQGFGARFRRSFGCRSAPAGHNSPTHLRSRFRMPVMTNSFGAESTLSVGGKGHTIYKLSALETLYPKVRTLPFCLKILLENLLRCENGVAVRKADIIALAQWNAKAEPSTEIGYTPARVLLQDFTGVPCVVDLAAMRDAMKALGGDPARINPLVPCELVIDHSVQVDSAGTPTAFAENTKLEYERNQERYTFLRWGQDAFENFQVVPPETGIVHQVNVEYLARVVFVDGHGRAYPDTLVGTDSHTTMVNGLGVLGWGVGGIEAEAAMLGQPVSMLIPQVVGFKMTGKLKEGATATDLVLTVTQMLRKKGVVGKFVEFFGPGLAELPLADRATIANMAPEYGATCGIFPVDAETVKYLRGTGRKEEHIAIVEAYCKEQGMFHDANTPPAEYTDTLELDLATVVPSLAGPARPQDRVALTDVKKSFYEAPPEAQDGPQGQVLHPAGDRGDARRPSEAVKVVAGIPARDEAGGRGGRLLQGAGPAGGPRLGDGRTAHRGDRADAGARPPDHPEVPDLGHGRRQRREPRPMGLLGAERGPARRSRRADGPSGRFGRHRGHHELHEHEQPVRHDRGGHPG